MASCPLSECQVMSLLESASMHTDSNRQVVAGREKPDYLRVDRDVARSAITSAIPGIAQASDSLSDLRNKRC
jgi:hypothetical protein